MSFCPHCGCRVLPKVYERHARVCLGDPAVAKRVRRVLQGLSHLGVIPSRLRYDREARIHPAPTPSARFLVRHLGSWDEVAKWARLRPLGDYAALRLTASLERLRALSVELHGGVYGPTFREYEHRHDVRLLSSPMLSRAFGGTWRQVLAAAGLTSAPIGYYRQVSRRRENAALARIMRCPKGMSLVEIDYALERKCLAAGLPAMCARPCDPCRGTCENHHAFASIR